MITKQADLLLGSAAGAIRAGRLSAEDKTLLNKQYGLVQNSNMRTRNAGRGILGGMAGGFTGSLAGTVGALALKKDPRRVAQLLGLAGSAAGITAATDKYSRGAARRLRANPQAE